MLKSALFCVVAVDMSVFNSAVEFAIARHHKAWLRKRLLPPAFHCWLRRFRSRETLTSDSRTVTEHRVRATEFKSLPALENVESDDAASTTSALTEGERQRRAQNVDWRLQTLSRALTASAFESAAIAANADGVLQHSASSSGPVSSLASALAASLSLDSHHRPTDETARAFPLDEQRSRAAVQSQSESLRHHDVNADSGTDATIRSSQSAPVPSWLPVPGTAPSANHHTLPTLIPRHSQHPHHDPSILPSASDARTAVREMLSGALLATSAAAVALNASLGVVGAAASADSSLPVVNAPFHFDAAMSHKNIVRVGRAMIDANTMQPLYDALKQQRPTPSSTSTTSRMTDDAAAAVAYESPALAAPFAFVAHRVATRTLAALWRRWRRRARFFAAQEACARQRALRLQRAAWLRLRAVYAPRRRAADALVALKAACVRAVHIAARHRLLANMHARVSACARCFDAWRRAADERKRVRAAWAPPPVLDAWRQQRCGDEAARSGMTDDADEVGYVLRMICCLKRVNIGPNVFLISRCSFPAILAVFRGSALPRRSPRPRRCAHLHPTLIRAIWCRVTHLRSLAPSTRQ